MKNGTAVVARKVTRDNDQTDIKYLSMTFYITFKFTLQRTVFTYKLPDGSSASHIFNQCSYMEKPAKYLEKHLGKSDILSQCPTPSLLHSFTDVFTHIFAIRTSIKWVHRI